MAFASEEQAFRQLQALLGPDTVYLIDTYDTLQGAQVAAEIGKPCWGVRLDSGDLAVLAPKVRAILDGAGLHDLKIMATNDLDEYRIEELLGARTPIDAFGVGTQLATSADAPALAAVYKMVELQTDEGVQYTAKFSGAKSTMPAPKQVFRLTDHDVIAMQEECSGMRGEPLLRPIMAAGELLESLPDVRGARSHAAASIARLPKELLALRTPVPYRVDVSERLLTLTDEVRRKHTGSNV
jgi:nicotinate phosphoribosyltransferase